MVAEARAVTSSVMGGQWVEAPELAEKKYQEAEDGCFLYEGT